MVGLTGGVSLDTVTMSGDVLRAFTYGGFVMAGANRTQSRGRQPAKQQQKPKGDKPAFVVRIGKLKLSAWANKGENGEWFSCKLARIYMNDKKEWEETGHFNDSDLPQLAELMRLAYTEMSLNTGRARVEWLDGRAEGGDGEGGGDSGGGDDFVDENGNPQF